MIRGALEAVALMLFPVVVALALVVPERMPQYVRLHIVFILWLQLWPPLMGVVNELASLSARDAMAKLSALSQGEIDYSTYDPVLNEIVLHQATASYLLVLVPLLAHCLAKGTGFAGVILVARFLQPSEGFVAQRSRSVATGNRTMDQVNLSPSCTTARRWRTGSTRVATRSPGPNPAASTSGSEAGSPPPLRARRWRSCPPRRPAPRHRREPVQAGRGDRRIRLRRGVRSAAKPGRLLLAGRDPPRPRPRL